MNKDKRPIGFLWKAYEGSRVVWKVQATRGILTFRTKKQAIAWLKALEGNN